MNNGLLRVSRLLEGWGAQGLARIVFATILGFSMPGIASNDTMYYAEMIRQVTDFGYHRCERPEATVLVEVALVLDKKPHQRFSVRSCFRRSAMTVSDTQTATMFLPRSPGEAGNFAPSDQSILDAGAIYASASSRPGYEYEARDSTYVSCFGSDTIGVVFKGEIVPAGHDGIVFDRTIYAWRSATIREVREEGVLEYRISIHPKTQQSKPRRK